VVSVQNPIALDDFSEPEPDVALLAPRRDMYEASHPGPADVYLIVEVADSSLRFDRERKIPLYAKAGIPEVWLVDLVEKNLMRYRKPVHGAGILLVNRFRFPMHPVWSWQSPSWASEFLSDFSSAD
jgi:Uma2 family endonuclease